MALRGTAQAQGMQRAGCSRVQQEQGKEQQSGRVQRKQWGAVQLWPAGWAGRWGSQLVPATLWAA